MFILLKAVLHDACHWLSGFRVSKERIAFILKGTVVIVESFKIKANRFFESSGNTFPPYKVSYHNNGFLIRIAVKNSKLA
jgi:hypothetical protein